MDSLNNTVFTGKVFIELPEVDSTNAYALRLLSSQTPPPHGTVVFSSRQMAGRGQRGNEWQSESGKNIAASFIFYPRMLAAAQQFYLSMAIALGVCRFLQHELSLLHEPLIKWPNDLYIQHKKVAGILIENTVSGSRLSASVVGIGLNVNQTAFENLPHATSLQLLAQRQFNLRDTVQKLCTYVEAAYFLLQPDKLSALKRQYMQNLYQFGVPRHFVRTAGNTLLYGYISRVLDNGHIEITHCNSGQPEYFDLKEIAWS